MILLREIECGDVDLLADCSYEKASREKRTEMIHASIEGVYRGRYFKFLVAEKEGVCIGFMNLYAQSDIIISCGPEIKKSFRRRGFAFEAEKAALEYAKKRGFTYASAQVRVDNAASIALHKKLGFVCTGQSFSRRGAVILNFEKPLT